MDISPLHTQTDKQRFRIKIGFTVLSFMTFTPVCGSAATAIQVDKQVTPVVVDHVHLAANPADCVGLLPWPGDSSNALVSVTMQNAGVIGVEKRLGPLIVKRYSLDCNLVASNTKADQTHLARTITPSMTGARVNPAVFRISPSEVALGVDTDEELTTTSISWGKIDLILYRHVGVKLTPIFEATTYKEEDLDKMDSHDREDRTRHIVRFTSHLTNGFYDLVLAQPHQRRGRTFVWTGTDYAATIP